MISAFFFSNTF
jgi:hypothetical protein